MSMQYRKAELGTVDLEARSVPLVLTTEYPVRRDGFFEILDMGRVDLSRGDLPLIEGHDQSKLNIGVIRHIRVDGNKLRGVAIFGRSARATEVLTDVMDGIVTGVSIGYMCTDEGQPVDTHGKGMARKFGFMPYEASCVSVPADVNAGFFRSAPVNQPNQTTKGIHMENQSTLAPETRNHPAEISAIARSIPGGPELAMRAIEDGLTTEQFQQIAIRALSTKPLAISDYFPTETKHSQSSARVLRTPTEIRSHYALRPDFANSNGVGLADFMRGAFKMKTTQEATRALGIAIDSAGGYAVPTAVMPGIFAALAPASSLMIAGAGILPLPDGAKSFNFAAVDALPVASWRNEGGSIAVSQPTFKNLVVAPKSLSFVVKISRELLADAPNVEEALNTAIGQAFAKEIDRVGLIGTGTAPEPRGLKNTSGIQLTTPAANGTSLATAKFAPVLSGVQSILEANGPMPTALIMSPRSLVSFAGLVDGQGQPLERTELLAGISFIATTQISNALTQGTSTLASEMFLGNFSNMFIAMREQLNVQILNEHYSDTGEIGFLCHARLDIGTQVPQAFCRIPGIIL